MQYLRAVVAVLCKTDGAGRDKQRMNWGPGSFGIIKFQMHSFSGFIEEMWA